MALTVNKVEKRYGSRQALYQIDFSLEPGEITGLLGANGAGKSTLLKILACYFHPSQGSVSLNGTDPVQDPGNYRRMVGFLPEGAPLPLRKTPRELLKEKYLLHFQSPPVEKDLDRLMGRYGLGGEEGFRPVKTLSRGFRQRTGLALAELAQPGLLLLDEPFSGLDPTQIRQLRNLLKQDRKSRITLFSSHILQEIFTLCDRIIILHEGTIRAVVRRDDFLRWEELDELYSRLAAGDSHE